MRHRFEIIIIVSLLQYARIFADEWCKFSGSPPKYWFNFPMQIFKFGLTVKLTRGLLNLTSTRMTLTAWLDLCIPRISTLLSCFIEMSNETEHLHSTFVDKGFLGKPLELWRFQWKLRSHETNSGAFHLAVQSKHACMRAFIIKRLLFLWLMCSLNWTTIVSLLRNGLFSHQNRSTASEPVAAGNCKSVRKRMQFGWNYFFQGKPTENEISYRVIFELLRMRNVIMKRLTHLTSGGLLNFDYNSHCEDYTSNENHFQHEQATASAILC